MNRAQILEAGTFRLRSGLPGVSLDVDPAAQQAAARRVLLLAQGGDERHLGLRSHQRDYSARALASQAAAERGDQPAKTGRPRDLYRQDRILEIAGRHPDGASRAEMAAELGVDPQNLSSPLTRLTRTRKIRLSGVKGSYRYHRVPA